VRPHQIGIDDNDVGMFRLAIFKSYTSSHSCGIVDDGRYW
jgi:hypothetical protein